MSYISIYGGAYRIRTDLISCVQDRWPPLAVPYPIFDASGEVRTLICSVISTVPNHLGTLTWMRSAYWAIPANWRLGWDSNPRYSDRQSDALVAMLPSHISGAIENRTRDLLNAIQTLSQLSYNPILTTPKGLEPSTSSVWRQVWGTTSSNKCSQKRPDTG